MLHIRQAFAFVASAMLVGLGARVALSEESDAAQQKPATLPAIRVQADDASLGYVATEGTSATKTTTPLVEIPQSISVITRERMEALGAASINDALSYTAGVKSELWGRDSRYDWISIRGFDAYSPGFFQDGLLGRNNAAWAVWRKDPYGLESVEVVRGPASVLYGLSNPGGLVNLVSKRPTAEPFGEMQLQSGSFERLQGAVDLSGPLDDRREVLYRFTALARDSGSQVDHVESRRRFLAPALTWRPAAGTSVTLLSHYQKEDTGSDVNFLPLQGTLLPNPNGRIARDLFTGETGFDGFDKTQWSVGYRLEHRLGPALELHQNARYGEIDLDYEALYGTGLDPADALQRTLLRGSFTSREAVAALTVDTRLQSTVVTGAIEHTLLAGVDYQRHRFDQRTGFGSGPSLDLWKPVYGQAVEAPTLSTDAGSTLAQTGFYVQDQMKLRGRWVVLLSGRYDRASIDSRDRLNATNDRQHDREITGRAGLAYLSDTGLAPYISYSESFFPIAGTSVVTGQPFEPETGRQYEAGLKYRPQSFDALLTFAAFDIERRNYLTSGLDFIQRQAGEIASRGIELEATVHTPIGVNLTGAYSWLAEFGVTASSDPTEPGRRQPIVPEHTASLWADYRLQHGPLAGLGFGAGLRYTGSSFGDSANSAALKVPDTTLIDAMLDYERAPWAVAVHARNLTDEESLTCWTNCYYGSARSFQATLTYRW